MSGSRDEDLVERIERLERSIEDLRTSTRHRRRGPFGFPRPPGVRDVLRYLDDYAIPTAIAVLEANIRTLELVRGTLRLLDSERWLEDGSRHSRDRVDELRRTTLARLDDVLADVQQSIQDGGLPQNDEARRIVEEARRIRTEIASRIEAVDDRNTIDPHRSATDSEETSPEPIDIDIDDELASIKAELEPDPSEKEDPSGGDRSPDDHPDEGSADDDHT